MRIPPAVASLAVVIAAGCQHAAPPPPQTPPPPPPPAVATCAQVASHVHDLVEPSHEGRDDLVSRMTSITLERCTGDNWNDAMRACVMATKDLEAGHHCLEKLPEAQRTAFLAAAKGEPDRVAGTPPAVDTHGLPQECVEYRHKIDDYFNCPSLPDASRNAAKDAIDQAYAQWEQLPDDGKAALAEPCKSMLDAIQSLTCPP